MSIIDLGILVATLVFITVYGMWKTRKNTSFDHYISGSRKLSWGTIGLSVMATQASAITFISTPGLAYENGMYFIQNYFGLPIALILVSVFLIPVYYKSKVLTAYEYLESRFDVKTRLLAAGLFLLQRGLAAGITIYAPSIILSVALGWNIYITICAVGVFVIVYTVFGGSEAVSITQKQQMMIIFLGLFVAIGFLLYYLTRHVSIYDSMVLAGQMGKLQTIDFSLDTEKRYTVWSGLLGGTFLALSYFGTDQSQVSRYLNGKDASESKMGLMFNALLKIPMQFVILWVGVLLFVFYMFYTPPITFIPYGSEQNVLELENIKHTNLHKERKEAVIAQLNNEKKEWAETKALHTQIIENQKSAKQTLHQTGVIPSEKDSDYVFLHFILHYMPVGFVGLLIAMIFAAAMSSTSSELNALSTTALSDFFIRLGWVKTSEKNVIHSKWMTVFWGGVALSFAFFANKSENLIEAVNIAGSLFYGTILGIFIVAIFLKNVRANAIFYGAVMAQCVVIVLFLLDKNGYIAIGYLWYNVIGSMLTLLFSIVLNVFGTQSKRYV